MNLYNEPNYLISLTSDNILVIKDETKNYKIFYLYLVWKGDLHQLEEHIVPGLINTYQNNSETSQNNLNDSLNNSETSQNKLTDSLNNSETPQNNSETFQNNTNDSQKNSYPLYFLGFSTNNETDLNKIISYLSTHGQIILSWSEFKGKKSIWLLTQNEKHLCTDVKKRTLLIHQKISTFPESLIPKVREFKVQLKDKFITHPYYHKGGKGYYIDGKSGKTLKLIQGQKYQLCGEGVADFKIIGTDQPDQNGLINCEKLQEGEYQYEHAKEEYAGGKILVFNNF